MVTQHARRAAHRVKEKTKDALPDDFERPHAKRTATLGLSGRPLRWTITACAVTGFSLFGYDQGLMSSIISAKPFLTEFPGITAGKPGHENKQITAVRQGGVTASYEIGCFLGALWVLAFGEKIGRKPIITAGCFIIIIGTVISASAFGPHWGLGQFIVGRVITGVGNGFNTATIPVWQAEMARPEMRGRLVNLEGCVVAFGTMIAYWFDFGLHFVHLHEPWSSLASISWRFPVVLQILFALVVFVLLIGLPESPRWLILHGREEEAQQVISRLEDLDLDDPKVLGIVSIQIEDARRVGTEMRFGDLLQNGRSAHFQRMLVGASTQFFQQFTGCNAAIYYATVLFQDMQTVSGNGVLTQNQETLSLIMGGVFSIVYAVFTLPSIWLVEHLGRRNLFLVGVTGQAISFFITMGCLIHAQRGMHNAKEIMKGGAVGLYLFIAFFAMSVLPLPWVYPPEINPLKTRTAATAVSTCMNWLCNFAVVMFTPVFIEYKNWSCYLFFALMNCAWLPVIFFYYPETAGRSLEEVDLIFARAHDEGKFPFMVAASMPKMSAEEVNRELSQLGVADSSASDAAPGSLEKTSSRASSISALSAEPQQV